MLPAGDAQKLWQATCRDYLKAEISELTFQTWFKPAIPCFDGEKTFVLMVPNELSAEYVGKYADLIENALQLATQRRYKLSVQVGQEALAKNRKSSVDTPLMDASQAAPAQAESSAESRRQALKNGGTPLNPNYTFSNFVVGSSNNFAHAACVAVASMQGKNYNPLFLYGGSGLGKTHLMQAIGNHVIREFPKKKVLYVQTEQFVNEFIQVIANKKYDEFRNKYRSVDLLLIDDIQFIEKKEQMQEEFFHTFNAIYESGKNIVLTCDKPPQSLQTLEERLKTRISSGLTIDIIPPNYETRMAILERLSQTHGVIWPGDVMDFVASNVISNIRELEGAFKTLLAYGMLGNPINLETAVLALKDVIQPQARQKLDSQLIMNVCANFFHVSVDDLKSRKRNKELVEPRHVAMYLCYNLINMTYADIGSDFGGKNHATVIYACDKVKEDMQNNSHLKNAIDEISMKLKP